MISKKIILVGDFATGKTSLIRRFVDDQFSDSYLSTIGVKISKKEIALDEVTIRGLIWDLEGGTPGKPVNRIYFAGAHGAILVSDVTREETLVHIGDYIAMLKEKGLAIPRLLVLNKCDKIGESERNEVLRKAKSYYEGDIDAFFMTSAKTGEGVEDMFHTLAQKML